MTTPSATRPEEGRRLTFGRYVVQTSSEHKVLYPRDDITKGVIIEYYRAVARYALRFGSERFLTLQRFPDGLGEDGFYQQSHADYFPDYVDAAQLGPAARCGVRAWFASPVSSR